jgi:hypothetical protein
MSPDSANAEGATPLLLAASKGHNVRAGFSGGATGRAVRFDRACTYPLIAQPSAPHPPSTPPPKPTCPPTQDVVLALLFLGADPSKCDSAGRSPLLLACQVSRAGGRPPGTAACGAPACLGRPLDPNPR